MCAAVSACRARRISRSRSIGGVPRASFRRRCASSVKRCSSGIVCLKRRRSTAQLLSVRGRPERNRAFSSPIEAKSPGGDVQKLTLINDRCLFTSRQKATPQKTGQYECCQPVPMHACSKRPDIGAAVAAHTIGRDAALPNKLHAGRFPMPPDQLAKALRSSIIERQLEVGGKLTETPVSQPNATRR